MPKAEGQDEEAVNAGEGESAGVPGVMVAGLSRVTVAALRQEFGGYRELAAGLNVPEGVIRNMKKDGVVTPFIERGNYIVFHIPTFIAEVKKYAGIRV